MKLMPVTYQGFVAMDRRFSSAMLPWIVAEIRRRDYNEKLSLGIEDGVLQAYNMDFELQFAHRVHQMARFSQADLDAATFLYLMRDDADRLLYCYLFQAHQPKEVTELYRQMKEQSLGPVTRSSSGAAALTSLCVAISPSSSNFFEVLYIGKIKEWQRRASETFIDDALEKFRLHELDKSRLRQPPPEDSRQPRRGSMEDVGGDGPTPPIQRSASCHGAQLKLAAAELKAAVDTDDHNRTMVLQVDRTDLRLISPDRKVILLHKQDLDVTGCMQGVQRSDHFGFICREGPPSGVPTYIGYVFKCESASIASDAVAAITQAFLSSDQRPRPLIASCEHCPMVWFHRVCAEVEHLSDKKTQTAILRRLEQLEADEQMALLNKFRGAETDSVREQNEFLMMLLRAHCESKQGRHIHDTAENRTEFLNQYLGGGTNVFSKAKKSFDQFLKRRTSERQMSLPIANSLNRAGPTVQEPPPSPEGFRSRASSIEGSASPERGPKSPMMDIFRKVGNSPKGAEAETGSWRQAIFKRVVAARPEEVAAPPTKRTPAELWRRGIRQAILLIRMEKENERLKAEQEESAVKRIKLEYDEMRPSQREVMEVWEMLTDKDLRVKCDKPMLLQAIRQGVPRGKRGEVWQFLAEQHCRKSAPPDPQRFPGYGAPYEQLLRQLTSHQHAILIDLGRTFPGHSYFSSPLGPGQLALFNLLKAYSLLDPEVGYCQGLSFVAGVLLLHMEEAQAFGLLRHLMFRRGMRAQYLPDMVGLQVRLYQLSRLLHDQLPDLYRHLDEHEVAPTLYAAPWILTVFASQFPLGFVTRVFDLVFLEGQDVVFRAALALLSHHKERILGCGSFEEIMDYFKTQLTSVDKPVLEKLMKKIYTTDVARQLEEYKVEYQVLQEEVASLQPQVEALQKLEAQNGALAAQNKALAGQLELSMANVQRLEKTRVLQQAQLNRLEMQSRGLDVTIAALGGFISRLVEDKALDVEVPDEVRRILAQIRLSERHQSEARGHNNLLKMLQEKEGRAPFMVKSLSTGRISVPADLDPMARTHSLNARSVLPPEKRAPFFSSSHSNILEQQRLHNSPVGSHIDIKVQECDVERRDSVEVSPTHSTDSGVGTPSSPSNHPLSNCGDVSFTYSGTKELKHLKSLKQCQRNSSPELL